MTLQNKPVYALMKQQARHVLIKTAEQHGIPWRKRVEELATSEIQQQAQQVTNTTD